VDVTLELYQELLGLVFKEVPAGSFWRWHEQVSGFSPVSRQPLADGGCRLPANACCWLPTVDC
jgi:hypothetical protein